VEAAVVEEGEEEVVASAAEAVVEAGAVASVVEEEVVVEAVASVVEAAEMCQAGEAERVGRRQLAHSAPTIHPPRALAPAAVVAVLLAAAGDLEHDQTSVSALSPRHVPEL